MCQDNQSWPTDFLACPLAAAHVEHADFDGGSNEGEQDDAIRLSFGPDWCLQGSAKMGESFSGLVQLTQQGTVIGQ